MSIDNQNNMGGNTDQQKLGSGTDPDLQVESPWQQPLVQLALSLPRQTTVQEKKNQGNFE